MVHPALFRTVAAAGFAPVRSPAAAARRSGRALQKPAARMLPRFLEGWAAPGYRPERHYMRGGRTAGAKSLAAAAG